MMDKNKYWKTLLGVFAEVLIVKPGAYATNATFEVFAESGTDGTYALFNADTNARVTTAAAATTWLFAAVKRGGFVEKTNRFRLSEFKAVKTAYAAPASQVSTATFVGTPVVGHYYSVKVIETTPGYQQFPTWEYGTVGISGDTITTIAARITTQINLTTSPVNKDTDPVATATASVGVITLTATGVGITFRLAFSSDAIADLAGTAAVTTAGFYGNGSLAQVTELEKESDVYKGVTTQYPPDGTRPEDWATVTSHIVAGTTYSIYTLSGFAHEASPTPLNQHHQKRIILLAIPTSATSLTADVVTATVLGL